jgi:hypothetical protein
MLDFRLPVRLHSIETTSIELLVLENMGVAVGISFLSHLQAEIYVLPVLVAAMLDFLLPVWSHSIETISVELLDPENIGVAVGISLLSHLQAEILRGWQPPPP